MLGETDLGFVRVYSNMRMGWFHPSKHGDILMPVLTGPGPALKAVGRLMRDPVRSVIRSRETEETEEYPPDIRTTTQYADLVSSVDELESMELQMRDPDGVVMETDHVGINDMEFKLSFLSKRERRRLDKMCAPEPWEPPLEPLPRYQIQVYFPGPRRLLDDADEAGPGLEPDPGPTPI